MNSSKLNELHFTSQDVLYVLRYNFVIISFILACLYKWYIGVLSPIASVINIHYLIAFCLIISLDFRKFDKFKILVLITLPICVVFIRRWLVTWSIITLVYQINYYNINIRKLALIAITILCFELFIQLEAILMGIFQDETAVLIKTKRIAHDFGTGNPNRLGMMSYELCNMLYLYFGIKKQRRILFFLTALLISYFIYYFSSCRTAFIGSIIMLTIAIAYWNKLTPKILRFFIGILPIILFGINIFIANYYTELGDINEVSTGRLWYITKYLSNFSSKDWFIGTVIETDGPLDGSYLEMILKGGILLCSLFSISFYISIIRYFKEVQPFLPIVISTLIVGLSETIITMPSSSTIILWMITLYYFIKYKPTYY